jgi:hypothetical protein
MTKSNGEAFRDEDDLWTKFVDQKGQPQAAIKSIRRGDRSRHSDAGQITPMPPLSWTGPNRQKSCTKQAAELEFKL